MWQSPKWRQGTGYTTQGTRHRGQGSRHRGQGAWHREHDTGDRVHDTGPLSRRRYKINDLLNNLLPSITKHTKHSASLPRSPCAARSTNFGCFLPLNAPSENSSSLTHSFCQQQELCTWLCRCFIINFYEGGKLVLTHGEDYKIKQTDNLECPPTTVLNFHSAKPTNAQRKCLLLAVKSLSYSEFYFLDKCRQKKSQINVITC